MGEFFYAVVNVSQEKCYKLVSQVKIVVLLTFTVFNNKLKALVADLAGITVIGSKPADSRYRQLQQHIGGVFAVNIEPDIYPAVNQTYIQPGAGLGGFFPFFRSGLLN